MMRHFALLIAAPLFFLVASCGKNNAKPKDLAPMTQIQTIATRPLCVGRFLIDVPVDAKVEWTDTRTSLTGLIKSDTSVTEKSFASRIRNELQQIEARSNSAASPLLKESQELKMQQAQLLIFRDAPSNELFYDVKALTLKAGTLMTFHDQAEDDKLSLAVRDVSKAVELASFRDPWATPSEPGFCFDHGFLPGKESSFEATGVQMFSAQFPGLMIALETQTVDQITFPGPSLIARAEQGQQILEPGQRATFLRKNPQKTVGQRAGQEVVTKRLNEGVLRMTGQLELTGQPQRLDLPGMSLAFSLTPPADAGQAATSEEAALKLWDSVVNSLRLRPGAL